MTNNDAAILRQARADLAKSRSELDQVKAILVNRPRTPTEELDAIPGRRLVFTLSGSQDFTTTNDGARGQAIAMPVSQDGIFVMTHYPLFMWKTSLPTNATDFGRWRPPSTWPLPDQVLDTNIIDISYELVDAGSGRQFQNLPVPAGLISRPDNLIPLPVPTPFAPNATVQCFVTYENILFEGSTATTQGTLVVSLPGYKIVNL